MPDERPKRRWWPTAAAVGAVVAALTLFWTVWSDCQDHPGKCSDPPDLMKCADYQRGRLNYVCCRNTEDGFYWEKGARLSDYPAKGVADFKGSDVMCAQEGEQALATFFGDAGYSTGWKALGKTLGSKYQPGTGFPKSGVYSMTCREIPATPTP